MSDESFTKTIVLSACVTTSPRFLVSEASDASVSRDVVIDEAFTAVKIFNCVPKFFSACAHRISLSCCTTSWYEFPVMADERAESFSQKTVICSETARAARIIDCFSPFLAALAKFASSKKKLTKILPQNLT